eukprot:Lankesteria_metandrocarpae@DN5462_c1_g5_i1.p1
MSDDKYSFSLTTFSPSGKLVQIEYAINAVNTQGKTALGIKAKNGVVLATEKKVGSSLVDSDSLRKIEELTPNCGCVFSGMPSDFRVLLSRGRKSAQAYKRIFREPPPVSQLVRDVAAVMQEFTQSGGVRPFGISLLVAGHDAHGPQLYQVDPSGAYFAWKASSIGRDSQTAKTFLEKRYDNDIELEDAIHTAILTLKEGFEGAMDENNIEIAIVDDKGIFRVLTVSEIKDYLQEVE